MLAGVPAVLEDWHREDRCSLLPFMSRPRGGAYMDSCSGVPGYERRGDEIWGEAELAAPSIAPVECGSNEIDEELDESRVFRVGTQITKTAGGLRCGKASLIIRQEKGQSTSRKRSTTTSRRWKSIRARPSPRTGRTRTTNWATPTGSILLPPGPPRLHPPDHQQRRQGDQPLRLPTVWRRDGPTVKR